MIIDDTALISDLINRISEYMETQRSYNQNVVEEAFAMKEISARI
jgi:hypothetical protein